MDKLPKKITPDRIRDAIVQVFFKTDIPQEPLIGYLYSVLTTQCGLQYLNRPPLQRKQDQPILPQTFEIHIPILPTHFFYNEEMKVHVLGNSLVFNCFQGYMGWSKYLAQMSNVLHGLSNARILTGFNRVGIRYTSEFANIDIWEQTEFTFRLFGERASYDHGSFALSWTDSAYRINLHLSSKAKEGSFLAFGDERVDFISLIDIDVICENFETSDPIQCIERIDLAHQKEKEIFFRLLRPEFLATLNPEYN